MELQLSGKRRLTLSEYRGKTMISLREYYEKDGKTLPGKGISLLPEQLALFVQVLPELTGLLERKGVEIPRADYDGTIAASKVDKNEEGDEEDEDDDDIKKNSKSKKNASKKNYESTSEEED
jgi:hypothetical protein